MALFTSALAGLLLQRQAAFFASKVVRRQPVFRLKRCFRSKNRGISNR